METQEHHEQEQDTVTPPPFHSSETHEQEPTTSPTLADKLGTMGLDEGTTKRLTELTAGLNAEAVTPELLTTLAHGITHDDDVQTADAAGYLRGRNEKIEAVLHPQPEVEENNDPGMSINFPRYCRRSIWD